MNENIDLTQILKDCPKGWKFYSSIHGELLFSWIYESSSASQITFIHPNKTSMTDSTTHITVDFYRDGRYFPNEGECTIFPSKDQRDWSKFTAPWYKPEKKETETKKFDPTVLKAFDKVLILKDLQFNWMPTIFTYLDFSLEYPRMRYNSSAVKVIPYNDDTKHLVGTTDEAPEYYQYWEGLNIEKKIDKNNVRFYVARDKHGTLWLYMGKPVRRLTEFISCPYGKLIADADEFSNYGLNVRDFVNLEWEDEPIEVFINLED